MISKNIFFRYEENLNGGTLLIFDLKDKKIYKGNKAEYQLLLLFEKGYSFKQISEKLDKITSDLKKKKINDFYNFLIKKGIVYEH